MKALRVVLQVVFFPLWLFITIWIHIAKALYELYGEARRGGGR